MAWGPDINMAFFQASWSFMKADLIKVFNEFFYYGRLTTSINSTFITVVPKTDQSINVQDCRPIGLVTNVYRIIIKVLSMM